LGVFEPEISSEDELADLLKDPKNSFEFRTKRPEPVEALLVRTKRSDARVGQASKGFRLESFAVQNTRGGTDFFLADDVLAPLFVRERTGTNMADRMDLLLKIAPGDTVVHRDYGVGVFRGCEKKSVGKAEREFIRVEYAGGDTLFVPLSEIYRVSKYLGDDSPALSKLGGTEWKKSVERAEEDAEKVARELLDIYAKRKIAERPPYKRHEKEEAKFCKDFPYDHTADQARAIEEILSDMEGPEPMDRLLSGDVGFGKTEVAMNAAYRAVLDGRQVAFVSPLVVLAYEHWESLKKRFEPFGARIAVLTRFSKESEERAVLKGLRDGSVDIVVGTHRLLSSDVRFRNLGLLVVDEEHRFGVLDKEKITGMREHVDILSLSATPIPRSLNLALSGIKKVSILTTPPPRKKPIATSVSRWNPEIVRNAIDLELDRGGQVIVLHNRVKTLERTEEEIRQACAGCKLRIVTTHGQMHGTELEDRIIEFKEGRYDILLSTTVIENGVNFLQANTILIDEADEFGLASLHQLRGRVGRKDMQAYCHLLYRKELLPDDAKRRLVAIASNSHLGAGFEISMRDLEIRGAGEILGVKQSGRTKETGLPLYFRLLEEKVAELRDGKKRAPDAKIDLDLSYGIPDSFFDSEIDKLHFFRSLESVSSLDELETARASFFDRTAILPEATENLFLLVRARIRLTELKVASLKRTGNSYVFEFAPGTAVADLRKFLEIDTKGEFVFTGNGKIRTETENFKSDADFLKFLVQA
jgi:transcription-repair coupling factor (superfamily II helicase)